MKKKKLVLPVLIVWLMALTASGWLGSFILVKIASLPTDNLQWSTYLSTLAYYGWQPSLKKYLFAGLAGTLLPFLIALILTVVMFVAVREKKRCTVTPGWQMIVTWQTAVFFPTKKN
ncbi:hypothetical protein AB2I91_26450 (plasmid) [Escherichia coli]